MKLKLIVASMGMLGFISCPLYAATDTSQSSTNSKVTQTNPPATPQNASAVAKQKAAHPTPMHPMHRHNIPRGADYYEEGGYVEHHPGPAPGSDFKNEMVPSAPEACGLTDTSIIMDGMTQNVNRSLPNPCNPGWFERVFFSGGVNVDLGKWGRRGADIMGENYMRVSLNDAYLNIFAIVNNWATAFASISYNTTTNRPGIVEAYYDHKVAEYSAAYDNNARNNNAHALQLEQAYATISNFEVSPFFIQLGKQFQDFSRYQIHPITRSLTQVMSETLATSFKAGFITNGFSGTVFAFDDPLERVGRDHNTTNYGASLGYERPCEVLGWSIGVGYLYNLIGVNDIAYNVNQWNILSDLDIGYHKRVSGIALYADVNSGPFTLSLRYTAALNRFDNFDLPRNGIAAYATDPVTGELLFDPLQDGAKPWTAGIQADYGFEGWCGMPQNVFIGYQTSRQAAGLELPKDRWIAGYGIEVMRNTNVSIEWDHDIAYKTSAGGSGENGNLVTIRAAVQFG